MLQRLDLVTTTASRVLARVNRVSGGRENVGTFRKDYLTTLPLYCPIASDGVGVELDRFGRTFYLRGMAHLSES